jgi:hypothetical protein
MRPKARDKAVERVRLSLALLRGKTTGIMGYLSRTREVRGILRGRHHNWRGSKVLVLPLHHALKYTGKS